MEAAAEQARRGHLDFFQALPPGDLRRLCRARDEDGRCPRPGQGPRRLCSAPGRKRQLTAAEEPRSQVVGRGSGRCCTQQRRAGIRLWSASWPPMGPRTRSTTPMTRWVRLISPCRGTSFEHGRADSATVLYALSSQDHNDDYTLNRAGRLCCQLSVQRTKRSPRRSSRSGRTSITKTLGE